MTSFVWLNEGSWDLNSGTHASLESCLSTEPSPHLNVNMIFGSQIHLITYSPSPVALLSLYTPMYSCEIC